MAKYIQIISIIFILSSLTSPSFAKDTISGVDGNTLVTACLDKKSVEGKTLCATYIAGFKDTIVAQNLVYKKIGRPISPIYCLPQKGLSHQELLDFVIKSLSEQIKTDPSSAKVNASVLILYNLAKKYPCQLE